MNHHLVAGTGGGVFTAVLLHPLDVIKVRFQVQDGTLNAIRYRTIRGAIADIWSSDGVRGFYRGLVPAMWGSGMSWGLYFYFYEGAKRRMLLAGADAGADAQSKPGKLSPWQHMYAAWEGGSITCLFTNPFWLIKTRMQLQTNTLLQQRGIPAAAGVGAAAAAVARDSPASTVRPYSGMANAFLSIVREEGPLGLYRGLFPALLLTSHGMVQFGVYEELKARVPVPPDAAPGTASAYLFAFGAVSKAAATSATYPYQVVKARMQQRFAAALQQQQQQKGVTAEKSAAAIAAEEEARKYRGFLASVRTIWRHEGVWGFYKGFVANLLRVAPQSAITLVAYEAIKEALDAFDEKGKGGR